MRSLVLVVVLLATLSTAQAGFTSEDFDFTSHDGTVLKATRYIPDTPGPWPAMLTTHGFPGRHDEGATVHFGEHYAQQGYFVVAWTARGFGESEGEVELDGPKEVADAKALVEMLAAEPNVVQDEAGDPRVGMIGVSYGGAIQFLTAQDDPRIDAIVPITTWYNLLDALAPDDVLKFEWASLLLASGTAESRGIRLGTNAPDSNPNPDGTYNKLPEWYLEAMATNGPTEEMRQEIGFVRSMQPDSLTTPTFLLQGWPDTLFTMSDALDTYTDLTARGVPVRLSVSMMGHGGFYGSNGPYTDNDAVTEAAVDDWLNHTLKGTPYQLPPYPILRVRPTEGDVVGELQWPPAGINMTRLYLTDGGLRGAAGALSAMLPNLVVPTGCAETANFQSDDPLCPRYLPQTDKVLAADLPAGTEITGEPILHLNVASSQPTDARVFVTMVDIDAGGNAMPIYRQVTPIHTTGIVDVPLEAITYTIPDGHKIGIRIAASDLGYSGSHEPGLLTISGTAADPAYVDLPVVPKDAWGDREAPNGTIAASVLLGPIGERAHGFRGYVLNVTTTDNLLVKPLALTDLISDYQRPESLSAEQAQFVGTCKPVFGPTRADAVPCTETFEVDGAMFVPTPGAGLPIGDGKSYRYSFTLLPFDGEIGSVRIKIRDAVGHNTTLAWQMPADWQAEACEAGADMNCETASPDGTKGTPVPALVPVCAVALAFALTRRLRR